MQIFTFINVLRTLPYQKLISSKLTYGLGFHCPSTNLKLIQFPLDKHVLKKKKQKALHKVIAHWLCERELGSDHSFKLNICIEQWTRGQTIPGGPVRVGMPSKRQGNLLAHFFWHHLHFGPPSLCGEVAEKVKYYHQWQFWILFICYIFFVKGDFRVWGFFFGVSRDQIYV